MYHRVSRIAAGLVALFIANCGDAANSGVDAGAGTFDAAPDAGPVDLVVTIDDYPLVDGSTSTLPLARVVACHLLGLDFEWVRGIGDEGIAEILPVATTPEKEELAAGILEHVVHSKTHQAYLNLVDRLADLILVANPPSDEETAYAEAADVVFDQRQVATDGLVILVNEANPITELTTEQIRAIFMGTITEWSQVGGSGGPIHPYVRPHNSGSQQLMDAIVMAGLTMPDWPPDRVIRTMGGLIDEIKTDPLAIGYSVYFYVTYQYPPGGHHVINVDGIEANPDTLASGSYPFAAPVWVIIRTDLDPFGLAYQLRDWLLGPEGQTVVGSSGYVPL